MNNNLESKFPTVTLHFEIIYSIFITIFISGTYYDAWSHTHIPELETFFTPAHGLMYFGAGMVSIFIFYTMYKNSKLGYKFLNSMPVGYHYGFYGVLTFMIMGLGDLIWHELFGIETELEAAFSPTHLGLMTGIALITGTPLFSAWNRREEIRNKRFVELIPLIISISMFLSGMTVITQWAHLYVELYPTYPNANTSMIQTLGIQAVILQTSIIMGLTLIIVHDRLLPTGSLSIIFTINALFLSLMRDTYFVILSTLLAGLFIDLLYWKMRPSKTNLNKYRLFSMITPVIFYTSYYLILNLSETIIWSIHMITGSIFMAASVSLLISILVVPSSIIEDRKN
ncbi:MAG: hypothetical protein OEZ01_13025 [Candidatus Heimdallarchaeota archaeon]|nr:hypothetical protein [Candidatus Heimdallarchaeota archaeon]MDH5646930.1 hypothetical protein [Candidatus Heimdallarchaeota archaeon]